MLPVRTLRSVRPSAVRASTLPLRVSRLPALPFHTTGSSATSVRNLTTTRTFYQAEQENKEQSGIPESTEVLAPEVEVILTDAEKIELTVRNARQRFRDSLPDNYLTPAEYELYVRLYGAPLRKTTPEDVGIPTHHDYVAEDAPEMPEYLTETFASEDAPEGPRTYPEEKYEDELYSQSYVEQVSRDPRELKAMRQLEEDFKIHLAEQAERQAQEEAQQAQEALENQEEGELEEVQLVYEAEADPEDGEPMVSEEIRQSRLHKHTIESRFGVSPGTVQLPKGRLVRPVTEALKRAHPDHIRLAAETKFGGPGLPDGPSTPRSMKARKMVPIPLNLHHRRMTPIEADATLAAYMPPVYASIIGIMVEIRKKLGTEWIRGLMTKYGSDGPRILDFGGVGAGTIAWDQVLFAEWKAMVEEGLLDKDSAPKSRKSVVVGADLLRDRLAKFMFNTSFLPHLPDYVHSFDNAEQQLDAPQQPRSRKSYDVIVASHQLLQVEDNHKRRAVVNQLWSLLNPDGGVLIVMEKAHARGFEAVADVRQRILDDFIVAPGSPPQSEDIGNVFQRVKEPGMIVAPCNTHGKCPLYHIPGRSSGRKDFCHFGQRYLRPPYLQSILNAKHKNNDDIDFCYIAIQRGTTGPVGLSQNKRATDRAFEGFGTDSTDFHPHQLPRNIRPPLKKKGHISMDLCTPAGTFERWTVTKSWNKVAYHDARKIRWGDMWALGAKTRVENRVRMGRGDVVKDGGVKGRKAKMDEIKEMGVGKKPEIVNLQMNALGKAVPKQKPMKGYVHTKGGRHMAKSEAAKTIRATEKDLDRELHAAVAKKEGLVEE